VNQKSDLSPKYHNNAPVKIGQKKGKELYFYLQPQFVLELLVSIADGDLSDIRHI
jgi:hypothetical protein